MLSITSFSLLHYINKTNERIDTVNTELKQTQKELTNQQKETQLVYLELNDMIKENKNLQKNQLLYTNGFDKLCS